MITSGKNHQKVCIVTYLICIIQVYGASLTITQYLQCPNVSTTAILTCHIPSFTAGAQWIRNGFGMTVCQPGFCLPSSRPGGYQFSADATTMNVTISSLNITLDGTIWTCSHDSGIDIGSINLTICQFPSSLSIVGDNNRTLADGDTVVLSVSTGCITPSDSAHYNVTWKYVEANNTAEKNFDERIIVQNVSSIGGCTNTYEDNLKFNLIVTNEINTANIDLYISEVKMTFTMAGTAFIATKTVSYTLKPKVTTTTTTTTTTAPSTSTTCLPPVPVIVGVTVSGFLIILVIIFICCCCCTCCCLYQCRMKQNTEKHRAQVEETNDKENDDNFSNTNVRIPNQSQDTENFNETKAGIQNQAHDTDTFNKTKDLQSTINKTQAHDMTNVSRQSRASDKYKGVQSVDRPENVSY